MVTNTQKNQDCQLLFAQWQQEHQQLDQFTSELRQWAYEIAQLGVPHFGEAADKLTQLRQFLVDHFEREDQIGQQLLKDCGGTSVEVKETCRSASHDHEILLKRLDDLIAKLREVDPAFESWQDAVRQINLFMDAMDEHEEQESSKIIWLTPQSPNEST